MNRGCSGCDLRARGATLRDADGELLEGLKHIFSIQIGPRSQENPILQVSSIIVGRSFLLQQQSPRPFYSRSALDIFGGGASCITKRRRLDIAASLDRPCRRCVKRWICGRVQAMSGYPKSRHRLSALGCPLCANNGHRRNAVGGAHHACTDFGMRRRRRKCTGT